MSKKTQLKAAQKRAQRKVTSKNKVTQTNIHKSNEFVRSDKFMRKMDRLHDAMVRNGLDVPAEYVKNGGKVGQLSQLKTNTMIKEAKDRISDVFKLFSYATMAQRLVEAKAFEHEFKIDLKEMALHMTSVDQTFQGLGPALKRSNEDFAIEMFELGSELEAAGTALYEEIERLEPHSKIMEAHLMANAKELAAEQGIPVEQATVKILEAIAYAFLHSTIKVAE